MVKTVEKKWSILLMGKALVWLTGWDQKKIMADGLWRWKLQDFKKPKQQSRRTFFVTPSKGITPSGQPWCTFWRLGCCPNESGMQMRTLPVRKMYLFLKRIGKIQNPQSGLFWTHRKCTFCLHSFWTSPVRGLQFSQGNFMFLEFGFTFCTNFGFSQTRRFDFTCWRSRRSPLDKFYWSKVDDFGFTFLRFFGLNLAVRNSVQTWPPKPINSEHAICEITKS